MDVPALPDRQGFGGLFRKLGGIDEHEFEKQLQVADVAGQSGAEDPGPTPTFPSFSPTKVHQHCTHHTKSTGARDDAKSLFDMNRSL